jgi:hypothetical protein
MNQNALIATLGIVGLIVVFGSWYLLSGALNVSPPGPPDNVGTSTPTTTPTTTPGTVSRVSLAMLDTERTTAGKQRGCDRVVLVPFDVASTSAPLTAAMQRLFGLSTTSVNGLYNFIDRTNETLRFDRATIVNGTANVYLTGSLSGLAGVCDDPRTQIQIEETALQFPTVQRVQIHLNGQPTNLTPSQR